MWHPQQREEVHGGVGTERGGMKRGGVWWDVDGS